MPRRYKLGPEGEMRRAWNGKLPEEFDQRDVLAFMAETDLKLQGRVSAETLSAIRGAGYDYQGGAVVPQPGKEENDMSKDVILTPEQIAAEERRWLFEAPIAELAEVKGVTIDEAVKMWTEAVLQEAAIPIEVSVRPIEPQGKLIGFASVNFGGVVVDDFKVVNGQNGVFLGAPSKPDPTSRMGYRSTVQINDRATQERLNAAGAQAYQAADNAADELGARLRDMRTARDRKWYVPNPPANAAIDLEEAKQDHFAQGLGLYKVLLICIAGSFAGVVVEMLWCLVTNGYIESRAGLVYGPFNLLYGAGAALLTVCLYKYRNRGYQWSFLGGFVVGSVKTRRMFTGYLADRLGYNVAAPEYRLAPEHPFPAAPQDCFAAYRVLLNQYAPKRIVLLGESAGGNLVLSVLLQIKDAGLPMPAAALCIAPCVQFDQVLPSHTENRETEAMVDNLSGEVFDVAVDLRPGSATYGKWYGVVLSAENKKQFFIPKNFAHGFLVLSEYAEFAYKCTDFYHPGDEGGIAYDDPAIGIEWPIPEGMELVMIERDRNWGGLGEFERQITR